MDFYYILSKRNDFPYLFSFNSEPDTLIVLNEDGTYDVIDMNRLLKDKLLHYPVQNLLRIIKSITFKFKDESIEPYFRYDIENDQKTNTRVFMVGGFPDDRTTWRHQVSFLVEMGYCCVVLYQPLYVRYFSEWNSKQCNEYFENTMKKLLRDNEKIITMSHDFGCFWMSRFNKKYPQYSFKNIVVQYGDMGYRQNVLRNKLWRELSAIYENRDMSRLNVLSKLDFENIHSQLFYRIGGYNITWRMCVLFNEMYKGCLKKPETPKKNTLFVYGRQCAIIYFTDDFKKTVKTRAIEASHWPHLEKPFTFNKILKNYLV